MNSIAKLWRTIVLVAIVFGTFIFLLIGSPKKRDFFNLPSTPAATEQRIADAIIEYYSVSGVSLLDELHENQKKTICSLNESSRCLDPIGMLELGIVDYYDLFVPPDQRCPVARKFRIRKIKTKEFEIFTLPCRNSSGNKARASL